MTNSQESDSIAEKPEVVKTEAKSNRWNWKTVTVAVATACAVTIAGLFAINPKILNAAEPPPATTQPVTGSVSKGNWLYWLIEGIGLVADAITIKNEINGEIASIYLDSDTPTNPNAKIAVRPYPEVTRVRSETGIYGGGPGSVWENRNAEYQQNWEKGNYASWSMEYFFVFYDEEEEIHEEDEEGGFLYSGIGYTTTNRWQEYIDHPGAAQTNPDYPDDSDDPWSRKGFWMSNANSKGSGYRLKLISDAECYTRGCDAIDSELADAAKKQNHRYEAKVYWQRRDMKWIPGKNGRVNQGAKAGHWEYKDWYDYSKTISDIPTWEDWETAVPGVSPYPSQVRNEVAVGGADLRWNAHQTHSTSTVDRQPKDQPNAAKTRQNNISTTKVNWTVWIDRHSTRSD